MRKCDFEACTGHFTKFDSCRDEALYDCVADGLADDTTGDSEYRGHHALLVLLDMEAFELETLGESIAIEAGAYIVTTAESGAVTVARYDDEPAARVVFDHEAELYSAWDDVS